LTTFNWWLIKTLLELKLMQKKLSDSRAPEKRTEPRRLKLRNYRIEIKFVGNPIYQFRVIDVTTKGAGLLIKDDSGFLEMIEVGQIVDANFMSPSGTAPSGVSGTAPSGVYKVEIKHITKLDTQEYKGHLLVGLSIIQKLEN
jgi:hypothetical protein